MGLVAFVISLGVVALGVLGICPPLQLITVVRQFQTPTRLSVAAVFHLVFGVALFFAAPASRAPAVVRIVGVIAIVAV